MANNNFRTFIPVMEDTRNFIKTLDDKVAEMRIINSTEHKINPRKTYIILLDVETISVSPKLTYDISWCIMDKEGTIYRKRGYAIRDVFNDMKTMSEAYYYKKYSKYVEMLAKGFYELKNLTTVIDIMNKDMKDFNVKIATAYNSSFDFGALDFTLKHFNVTKKIEFPKVKHCVWSYAVDTLMNRPTYREFAKKYNMITASGKYYSTSAESCYKYLTNNHTFIEEHVGLFDCEIEAMILAYAYRQRVAGNKFADPKCWNKLKI